MFLKTFHVSKTVRCATGERDALNRPHFTLSLLTWVSQSIPMLTALITSSPSLIPSSLPEGTALQLCSLYALVRSKSPFEWNCELSSMVQLVKSLGVVSTCCACCHRRPVRCCYPACSGSYGTITLHRAAGYCEASWLFRRLLVDTVANTKNGP